MPASTKCTPSPNHTCHARLLHCAATLQSCVAHVCDPSPVPAHRCCLGQNLQVHSDAMLSLPCLQPFSHSHSTSRATCQWMTMQQVKARTHACPAALLHRHEHSSHALLQSCLCSTALVKSCAVPVQRHGCVLAASLCCLRTARCTGCSARAVAHRLFVQAVMSPVGSIVRLF
jgi:hypothetical protein